MQYSLPNDHFSRVGCIRRLATEQRLELNSKIYVQDAFITHQTI